MCIHWSVKKQCAVDATTKYHKPREFLTFYHSFQDGKSISATVAAAFVCYCRLFDNPDAALHMFCIKRGINPTITPSQKRYVQHLLYVMKLPKYFLEHLTNDSKRLQTLFKSLFWGAWHTATIIFLGPAKTFLSLAPLYKLCSV